MLSLRTRLLVAGSTILLTFLGLCGLALERAYGESAQKAEEQWLQGITYSVLGAADDVNGRLELNLDEVPVLLRKPQSGLEAFLLDDRGRPIWRSPGAPAEIPRVKPPDVNAWSFQRLAGPDRFALAFGFRWVGPHHAVKQYTALVLEDPADYEAQLRVFRRTLWAWLGGAAVGLLAALLLVQFWGLAPLRRLVDELRAVETADRAEVGGRYPPELTPLTGALNAMIVSERTQRARYRNALGDLAHSLKTPLAVLRGLGEQAPLPPAMRESLGEQVARMQDIVDHQLSKASTAGRRALAQPVAVRAIADKVVAALAKVYADRGLAMEAGVDASLMARVEDGDLYELLGNVLDNAAKWARARLRLVATVERGELVLQVEDDGEGFPPDAERLLARGARADTRAPGQGLGLAAVAEIVRAYDGRLELGRSQDLGGASVTIRLPNR
ncbi:MAG TPA: ATP-binding protein [Candidatus Binatia bacterium]|nr:ATP-binding protein [Candidatus Binatia bacterium]